ncbi:MAG: hypothetical protein JRN68_11205 [Nitrososphaerota archaeon]|nr:hypothetical protein [Candidatus Sysuiplasma acidicola]MDG6935244.1 hypothetical protein [Nitrososphaerota archaeon]
MENTSNGGVDYLYSNIHYKTCLSKEITLGQIPQICSREMKIMGASTDIRSKEDNRLKSKDNPRLVQLRFMVILRDEISTEGIRALHSVQGFEMDFQIPTIAASAQGSISIGVPSFLKIGNIDQGDIFIGNVAYKSARRGTIQLIPKDQKVAEAEKYYTTLTRLVNEVRMKNSPLFYEFDYNTIVDRALGDIPSSNLPLLKTMKDPLAFGIRIFEGDVSSDDVLGKPWKQITIEPFTQDLKRTLVSAIYRISPTDSLKIDQVMDDIEALLRKMEAR